MFPLGCPGFPEKCLICGLRVKGLVASVLESNGIRKLGRYQQLHVCLFNSHLKNTAQVPSILILPVRCLNLSPLPLLFPESKSPGFLQLWDWHIPAMGGVREGVLGVQGVLVFGPGLQCFLSTLPTKPPYFTLQHLASISSSRGN